MGLFIKFWGVRGSLPSSSTPLERKLEIANLMRKFFSLGYKSTSDVDKFLGELELTGVGGFGTATTCVQVSSPQQSIIIDGGSGIRHFAEDLSRRKALVGKHHLFLTHFHWDHLIGLPFFPPHFIPGCEVHYYAVQPELEELIRGKFRKPYFPVPFEDLRGKIFFHTLEQRKAFQFNDLKITPYLLDHPDPCWGFRIESGGKVYSHCVDTECLRVTRQALGDDIGLYQNSDLMYFDAQYTLPELAEKANWGHSAAQIGLDVAYRENVKRVLFCHHDPGASTEQIYELIRQTTEYENTNLRVYAYPGQKIPWAFAHEGMEVNL